MCKILHKLAIATILISVLTPYAKAVEIECRRVGGGEIEHTFKILKGLVTWKDLQLDIKTEQVFTEKGRTCFYGWGICQIEEISDSKILLLMEQSHNNGIDRRILIDRTTGEAIVEYSNGKVRFFCTKKDENKPPAF